MAEPLESFRRSAVAVGRAYAAAIESGDNARALGCAMQLLVRVGDLIPYEDEFNSAHGLLLNMIIALEEVGSGKERHPILMGRHGFGGLGQLLPEQEKMNGMGAAVMLFLKEHDITEDAAAKLLSPILGIGLTTVKEWSAIKTPQRKVLRAMADASLKSIKRDFEQSRSNDPANFAKRWLRKRKKEMFSISPR